MSDFCRIRTKLRYAVSFVGFQRNGAKKGVPVAEDGHLSVRLRPAVDDTLFKQKCEVVIDHVLPAVEHPG